MVLTNKVKAQLIILTAFVLGIVVGGSGQYLMMRQSTPHLADTTEEILEELSENVGLEADQKARIEAIVDETFVRYEETRNQVRPQFTAIRDDARRRIREILSPGQRVRYDQWVREQDQLKARKESASKK
ncbi:MAG: hypothetical protein IPM66_03455 [Acidobacteriota bacterium]|nr:MAG: hypothetical protein IPM66_03455 [Acidobacteriota bacterium]